MDRMLAYFVTKRNLYPCLDEVCKKILCERRTPSDGITIDELREAYKDQTSEKFPVGRCITEFLLTIPNVAVFSNGRGTRYFYTVE